MEVTSCLEPTMSEYLDYDIGITFLTTVKTVRNFYIHPQIIHEGAVIVIYQ